ncbi:hypothetical protein ACEPAG_3368 [Sanghuangporus baumii]
MVRNRGVMNPHDLAALLMVFAVDAEEDFMLSPSSEEAELYFHLANAALALRPVLNSPSSILHTIFRTVTFGMSLAINIGLRELGSHSLEFKMIQRRRMVFWELRQMDAWKSLGSGRSAVVHPDNVGCELQIDTDATRDENDTQVPSGEEKVTRHLRYFGANLTAASLMLETLVPSGYVKVREFDPRSMACQIVKAIGADIHVGVDGIRAYFQKYIRSLMKDISLRLLHRNFFARALLENLRNPIQSSFAPSFLSCYKSAISILRVVREHFNALSHVMVRYWAMWAHSLISAARARPFIRAVLPGMLRLRERARLALLEVGKEPDKLMKELGSVTVPIGQGTNEQGPVGREEFAVSAPGIASNGSGDCAAASILLPSTSIDPQPSTFPFDFGNNTQEFDGQQDNRVLRSLDDLSSAGANYSLPFSYIMGLGHVVPNDASQTRFYEDANEGTMSMSIDNSGSSSDSSNAQRDVRGLDGAIASVGNIAATASNPELVGLATLGCSDSTADVPGTYGGHMPSEQQLEMMLRS